MRKKKERKDVLVGVLKGPRDLAFLRREHWYRIPVAHAPVRPFRWLAFYQPAVFGRSGGRIRFYARVLERHTARREELLPGEPRHPRAHEPYIRVRIGVLRKLPHPVRNITPRRVSFGFTTLRRLRAAKNILDVYGIAPTEELMADALRRARIPAVAQRTVVVGGHRYRPDFTVRCWRGMVAIECDNQRAHSGMVSKMRDRAKDAALIRCGWTVVRFSEREIVNQLPQCILRVSRAIQFVWRSKMTSSRPIRERGS
ncbi:MAG: DUF559 domain-containing protein [bacterium]|nr:DUF559 domain-containing protein [bacterium]